MYAEWKSDSYLKNKRSLKRYKNRYKQIENKYFPRKIKYFIGTFLPVVIPILFILSVRNTTRISVSHKKFQINVYL